MSSGSDRGMSHATGAAADDPLQSPFASPFGLPTIEDNSVSQHRPSLTSAAAATAAGAAAGVHPPADRVGSTTALLSGQGPSSSTGAPTPAPARANDLLADIAADVGAEFHDCLDSASGAAAGSGVNGTSQSVAPPQVNCPHSPGRKKKLIPLRQVLRHSYEYHGLNELAMFCITALAVTLVLYYHWGSYTAIFKASVQQSFQSYGNPDWQSQSMQNVETMNDAVEYSMGWLEFWLQRANDMKLPDNVVRAQDYGDIQYVRVLANLDRNCDRRFSPHLSCYTYDPLYQPMKDGTFGNYSHSHPRNQYEKCNWGNCTNPDANTRGYANLLEWAGWVNVFSLYNRDSARLTDPDYGSWWAYTVIAPRYYGRNATRDDYIGRMYNITRQTNLNVDNCDWLASNCSVQPNPCESNGVPFSRWWQEQALCPQGNATFGPGIKRGNHTFVRDPEATTPGVDDILDLKSYLSKYAYSIVVDVLAANTLGDSNNNAQSEQNEYDPKRDRALFSLLFQRSAEASGTPDRVMWQISTTVPVRTNFYQYTTDKTRILFEVVSLICIFVVVYFQVWQFRICRIQFRDWKPFFAHYWNDYEIISTLLLAAWIIYYIVLLIILSVRKDNWRFNEWDVVTVGNVNAHWQLENLTSWANAYGAWLYMGIVVDFLIFVRVARYMRVHVGLKAFYQVFIIAGREFMDFAVFLLFILVLLGSASFAFFQLTGGNYQFLRLADGLAVMTRLTFGFLNYEDFQAQALGVGAAVSAVTLLFWLAVILLVVYTQNIILAIVAEAYEEAKAKLGTAETSFLMLVLMRLLFFFLYIGYRAKMFCGDIHRLFTGKPQLTPSQQARTYSHPQYPTDGGPGHGPGGPDDGTGGHPGSPGAGSSNDQGGTASPAHHFNIDTSAQGDQNVNSHFAANGDGLLYPSYSVMGVLPKDVESGLNPAPVSSVAPLRANLGHTRSHTTRFSFMRSGGDKTARAAPTVAAMPAAPSMKELYDQEYSIKHRLKLLWYGLVSERHDVRMYKDLLIAPKDKEDKGWIVAWKRRYWAPWCVARTTPVRGLMCLYQDFTSYKLKTECTWRQADELAQTIFAVASKPSATSSCSDCSNTSVIPPLTDVSYVDEDTLSRLFLLTSQMSEVVPFMFSPFPKLTRRSVGYLVQGIAEVYGVDEDDAMKEGLDTAQGSLSSGSGSVQDKDARLGQVINRRGTGGFFAQLNARRRDTGGDAHGKQFTMVLHAQRRLEEMAHKTERNLDLYRSQGIQQTNMTNRELSKQQAQQTEVLKAVKALQTSVQQLAGQQHAASGTSLAAAAADRQPASRMPSIKKGISIRKGAGLFQKSGGPALSRAGPDVSLPLGSPRAAESGHDTFSIDEEAEAGRGRAVSDATQLTDAVLMLQQQIEQQQQLLESMAAKLGQQPPGQKE